MNIQVVLFVLVVVLLVCVAGFLQKPRVRIDISQPSQTSAANNPKEHANKLTSEVTILLRFNVHSNCSNSLVTLELL